MLHTSACSTNLHAILADDKGAQQIVCEMADVMDEITLRDARGFWLASILNPSTPNGTSHFQSTKSIINKEYLPLFISVCGQGARIPTEATFFKEVLIRGVCYAIHNSTAYRNSYIQFWLNDTAITKHGTGRIEEILKCNYYVNGQQSQDIFLVVRQMMPIEAINDPYRWYNFASFLAQPNGVHGMLYAWRKWFVTVLQPIWWTTILWDLYICHLLIEWVKSICTQKKTCSHRVANESVQNCRRRRTRYIIYNIWHYMLDFKRAWHSSLRRKVPLQTLPRPRAIFRHFFVVQGCLFRPSAVWDAIMNWSSLTDVHWP